MFLTNYNEIFIFVIILKFKIFDEYQKIFQKYNFEVDNLLQTELKYI